MRKVSLAMLVAGAVLAAGSMITISAAQAPPAPPPPVMPPSLPPTYVADLMTQPGSAAFGAQWKTMEAKIVETKPIPEALPGYKTAYDISPHAGEGGFDDSKWPVIESKDLAHGAAAAMSLSSGIARI